MIHKLPPIVLVFAGNDPSGGAGLCADIQALASQGCHTAPVVTCLTVQDSRNVIEKIPVSGSQVFDQAMTVLADLPIAACKIGLLGSINVIEAVQQVLLQYPSLPVILDPILAAGGGYSLTNINICEAMITKLFPLVKVLTPNSQEARILTRTNTLEEAALQLLDYGCQAVCITGTHENSATVINSLYSQGQPAYSWEWPRLPFSYHGSGCTLASSLAGQLALGKDMRSAVYEAQRYTWTSLQRGFQAGHGQAFPYRLPL